jgi:Holliday junction resolvase RusA-like endonuclease
VTSEVDIWIAGKPRGKDRPRFDRRSGRMHTTDATAAAERTIQIAWRAAGSPRMEDVPLVLDLALCLERPAGHFRKDGSLSAEGLRQPLPGRQKPDIDNAVKLVMDALNGLAYRDDVQIVDARVVRRWTQHAGTLIRLRPALTAAA